MTHMVDKKVTHQGVTVFTDADMAGTADQRRKARRAEAHALVQAVLQQRHEDNKPKQYDNQ